MKKQVNFDISEIIQNKDVEIILKCSPATASRRIRQLKDALGLRPYQKVTKRQFFDYYFGDDSLMLSSFANVSYISNPLR